MDKKVGIVVVTYNRLVLLKEVIEAPDFDKNVSLNFT